jgi:hypothetical protein
VTDGGENDVGGIAFAALEMAAAEGPSVFMCPITASMALRRRSSHLMTQRTPRFWPEMKTRRGLAARCPRVDALDWMVLTRARTSATGRRVDLAVSMSL